MPRLIDADALYEKANMLNKKERRVVQSVLQVSPTVKAELVKHGRWVETEDGEWECTNCKDAVVICVCGKDVTRHKAVCPNCGAKMDGGADHEN